MKPPSNSTSQPRPAVFLDRDGVLILTLVRNGVPHPPSDVGHVKICPGVPDALRQLKSLGYLLLVVTNQPDVARGTQRRDAVERINEFLSRRLSIDSIYTCFHDTPDQCACRKPAPGLLLSGAKEHGVDLPASFMIGDRWSDIEAGRAAGCRTILIARPYSGRDRCMPDHVVADVPEAARLIAGLAANKPEHASHA